MESKIKFERDVSQAETVRGVMAMGLITIKFNRS